jgi:glycosyltransferase involved in cell wall biosynthesis
LSVVAACTIVSNNYLAFARVLAESYQEHHPGAPFYVCVVDRPHPSVSYTRFPWTTVLAEELDIPGFANFAFRYDLVELNTAVKPYFLTYLRDRVGLERVLYFDPDIWVHDRLDELAGVLDHAAVALIPHITQPLEDARHPSELTFLQAGIFNLGFLGLRLDGSTAALLQWWGARLYELCLASDDTRPLFVDQRWMDFAPAFVDDLHVERDPIYNVAYWNLAHRYPRRRGDHWQIDGRRVGFFHFSGIDLSEPGIVSRYQDRVTFADRPELEELFETYRRMVLAADQETFGRLPYGYGYFTGLQVAIPVVVRRLLRRVDPRGHRWSDPFAPAGPDSYLTWLTEPLEFPAGTLTRGVLALWEARPDLIRHFPDVCGSDLPRFIHWLIQDGEGVRNGLHPVFLHAVAARAHAPSNGAGRAGGPRPLPPVAPPLGGSPHEILATANLERPGAMAAWFNEQVLYGGHGPSLTRLAMLLHAVRTDVARAYPDPSGADRAAYARWFVHCGAREFSLHYRLVAPVLASLPLYERLRFAAARLSWSRRGGTSLAGAAPANGAGTAATLPAAASAAEMSRGATGSESRRRGLNVAGYFEMDTGVGQVARGSLLALQHAGWAAARITLDGTRGSRVAEGPLGLGNGLPFPATLFHVNADESLRALASLPRAALAQTLKVGYWFWELSHFPLAFADRFRYLDEVWAPSRFCRDSFSVLATVPVRHVPPCVPAPQITAGDRARWGLEEERFYFLFCFDVLSIPERKNPMAAIEALRRLVPATKRPVGLVLRLTRAERRPDLLGRLQKLAERLPVVFHCEPASRVDMDSLLASCDAYLSLHRSEGLGLLPIETMYLGKPVVATAYGGVTDFLDETTGYPVAYCLQQLQTDFGPYPRGAVWADPDLDDAVEQMRRVVDSPAESAARAAAGRCRAESLYGAEQAARRFARELERLLGAQPCRPSDTRDTVPRAASGRVLAG